MNEVIFFVNGNSQIGLGHITRCLAIAEMIKDYFSIQFVLDDSDLLATNYVLQHNHTVSKTYSLNPTNIVVIDRYDIPQNLIIAVKENPTVVIDDLGRDLPFANVIINHNLYAKELPYTLNEHSKTYLGGDFALLRKPFTDYAHSNNIHEKRSSLKNIFLCLGGRDNNFTFELAKQIMSINPQIQLRLIARDTQKITIQKWNKSKQFSIHILEHLNSTDMIDEINRSDLVICTASVMALEVLCIGTPLCVCVVADNQKLNATYLEQNNIALNLGELSELTQGKLSSILKKKISSPLIIDGKSPQRIQQIFDELQWKSL